MITPRSQPPLPMELRPERPARLSYTWLSHYARCKHSALLYSRYRGATTTPAMERGSLVHETIATLINDAMDHGWTKVPHEIAKAALFEQYASGNYTVPAEEWDHARLCVFNWAENFDIEPDKILGVEQLVVWDIGEWRISGKLDYCWRDGATVGVRDWKTAPSPATQEAWDKSFQVTLYSLLAAYGMPVTVNECDRCQGGGITYNDTDLEDTCEDCRGKGYTETLEPYPLGEGAQHFDIAEVYPALAFDDGGLMQRQRTMSRAELLDERSMLEALLEQVSRSFDTGEWPAVPSDDACGKCPCRRDCPLPDQLLPFTAIDIFEEAEHFAMAADVLKRERDDVQKALKSWVKANGPIPLGGNMQLNFVKQEVNETDYKGFKAAQAAGRVVDLDDFRGKRIQTTFKPEPVPEPESRDWGDEAPWAAEDLAEPPRASHGGSNRTPTDLSEGQEEAV